MNFSPEQIIALAPDAPSAKAGRSLAALSKWVTRGCDERALWGECQGSGKEPYRTQIDLAELAFRCTCPSRKFPCKHALGLFLLFASQPAVFDKGERPGWVVEWLEKRDQQEQRKSAEAVRRPASEVSSAKQPKKESARVKRTAERQERVAAGLAELELWLRDLTRQGLASVQTQPARYWEQMAARLVDAQAPGVARRLREISSLSPSVEGWSEVLLERLGLLYLLIESFKRIDTLPAPVQADVRTAIGWTYKEEELLTAEGVRDLWLVVGQRTYGEDSLRVRRTSLRGQHGAKDAAILDFAVQGQAMKANLLTGTLIDAELIFYPSNYPLRAVLKHQFSAPASCAGVAGHATSEDFLTAYAEGLARTPWIENFPALLNEVVPVRRNESWFVRDALGKLLPLSAQFSQGWKLLAVSGGYPVTLFGEWNGRHLLPLSLWAEGRYVRI